MLEGESTMTTKEEYVTKGNRIHFLDNLRTIIIFLVVLYHVGGVYECAGTWAFFWLVDDPATYCPVGFVNIVLDIFVMPTMFFISGYLTPLSLKNKDGWAFLKSRFRRLMIPWVIAVLTLIPLFKVIFLYSRGLPQEHWTTYFHFTGGSIYISQNWLWFLPVLFLFDILYVLLSKANIRVQNISLKGAVIGTFLIGLVYSFGIGFLVRVAKLSAERICGKTAKQDAVYDRQFDCLDSDHRTHLCPAGSLHGPRRFFDYSAL